MTTKRLDDTLLDLSKGLVDITDPCYDKDVWCRINDFKVKPGQYVCEYVLNDDPKDLRIVHCIIVHKDHADNFDYSECMKDIGEIGVDAGCAGFFFNKPDYDDNGWDEFCDYMFDTEQTNGYPCAYFRNDIGFWTTSGYGDGGYTVWAAKNADGEVYALDIDFGLEDFDEDEEDDE